MNEFPSVLHAVASHAKTIPDKAAIIEAETDRQCTYGELWAYVKAFSKRLAAAGVKRDFGDGFGTRVVVRCAQTIDFVAASLAVQLAGGVFVPVEKNIADGRIIEIMEETDSKILVAEKPLSNYECTYIPLADTTCERDDAENASIVFPEPGALSVILFTTGTTGKSKGVMRSHKSHTALLLSLYYPFNYNDEQIWLIPNPLSHTGGLNRIFVSLYSNCTAILLDGYILAKQFFMAITKYKATILVLLSTATEMYLRMCRDKLMEIRDQINYLTLIGSSFSKTQIATLRDIFTQSKIIEVYAATEVTGCYIDHHEKKYAPFCIGQPYPGTKLVFYDEQKTKIVDATHEKPGLFALKSDSMMLGYWKNPELTASVTRGDYIVLSDLGYKGDDGLYYFLGRADDVIISGAYKIAPLEIEEVANSFIGISESACVPVNDPIMGQVPKLYVVMKENHIFNFNEIDRYLKSKLEVTKVPRYIEEIEAIPKVNNKITRKELRNK